jgi:hypothetical protein
MRAILFATLLGLSLCACTAQPEPTGQARLYDSQRQVLEKARAVDATVQQAAQQQRAEEEAQTR